MQAMEPIQAAVMDVRSLCKYLQISERKVRSLVSDNEIPYFKIGKSVRFHKDEVDKWCIRRTVRVG